MKECTLYKKYKSEVQCLACAHKCIIALNKTGICGVRQNVKNKLYLLVYGKPIAMHVDPIEKKPLYHFLPNTKTFSIGTVGCNFRCGFCQNYEISQKKKIRGNNIKPEEIVKLAKEHKCKSISYTYNEPTIFIEFVKDVAELAHKNKLKNILVTNGYFTKESFDFISPYIDAMNIDLKSFSNTYYQKYCSAKLKPVLDSIKRAHKKGIHMELTTLLIPSENDSKKEIEKIARFISKIDENIPWHISRFFPHHKMKNKNPTPITTLKDAEKIGKKYLNVYLGNI